MIKESGRLQKPANIESPIAGTAKLLLRVESTMNALGVVGLFANVVPADAVIRKYKQLNGPDSTCCGQHQKTAKTEPAGQIHRRNAAFAEVCGQPEKWPNFAAQGAGSLWCGGVIGCRVDGGWEVLLKKDGLLGGLCE